jgi:hypothetical protein
VGNSVETGAPVERPAWESASELLRSLLVYAVMAPSRHNTQPWAFEIEGPEARVVADDSRALPVADPRGRELLAACGAAAENLRLAARHAGRWASVELLASRPAGLVARVSLEEPREPDPDEEELFAAIPRRRTNRFSFEEREVPPGLVARLARAAADAGASLRTVDPGVRPAVAELVAEADRTTWSDPRFRAELAAWTRAGARDGMPGWARGLGATASFVDRLLLRIVARAAAEERRSRQFALHAPSLAVLCTPADAPRDWARAGVAFQRVLLRAAAHGVAASYFSPAIAVEPVRRRLREALGETGWPQVLLRLGYGREVRPTPRRPVEAALRAWRPHGPSTPVALARRPRGE